MSYTEIYKFNKQGDGEFYDEVKNAFLGAMNIWTDLEEKYLEKTNYSRTMTGNMDEIFDLVNNKDIPIHERIVLASTFDYTIVERENIKLLLQAIDNYKFLEKYSKCNIKEQALIIKHMLEEDPSLQGVGWNQTSVKGDNWGNFYYNEELEEENPYNMLTGKKHYTLSCLFKEYRG